MGQDDLVTVKGESIGKVYRIGLKEELKDSFGGTVIEFLKSPMKNFKKYRSLYQFEDVYQREETDSANGNSDVVWAVRDVSFEVRKGEVLGIIGRNGAGKSTLLKILSRITSPSTGRVEIRGSVSSLLEVGTGFHPELTGRENVYLNGTILGMKKKEIDRKLDQIVDFSGVGRFIDTPVKRYSSGMQVRLAFSVAAHLDPEILIVDEVLAVGDIDFQQKCIGRMDRISKEGRTVLFVSHNLGAISRLCSRVLWLEDGKVKMDGPSSDVVSLYVKSSSRQKAEWSGQSVENGSERAALLRHAKVLSEEKHLGADEAPVFKFSEEIGVEIAYEITKEVASFQIYLLLRGFDGNIVWGSHDTDGNEKLLGKRAPGFYRSICKFPNRLLRPGWYQISIGMKGKPRENVDQEELDIMSFQISDVDYPFNSDPRMGILTPWMEWRIIRE